jgi:hypothetical protein
MDGVCLGQMLPLAHQRLLCELEFFLALTDTTHFFFSPLQFATG